MARNTPATRRNTPATRPTTRGAPDTTAVTVLEAPPAVDPPAVDPEADVQQADTVLGLVGQRLTETELAVTEARDELRGLALLAEFDGTMAAKRDAVRTRLRDAESRLGELQHAQEAARDLSREARARALEARKASDWQAAAEDLDEALTTARSLDSLLKSAGDLYSQLAVHLAAAAARVGRHLSRPEHNIPLPDISDRALLVLSNAGGPPVMPSLHLDATERDGASIAAVIEDHTRQVLARRPMTTPEQEDAADD